MEGPLPLSVLVQRLHVEEDLRFVEEEGKATTQDPLQARVRLHDLHRREVSKAAPNMSYANYRPGRGRSVIGYVNEGHHRKAGGREGRTMKLNESRKGFYHGNLHDC